MTIQNLLAELRRRDVTLSPEGDGLRCSAPPGALTGDLCAEIVRWKTELIGLRGPSVTAYTLPPAIVPIHPYGTLPPVFAVPGHDGDVFCYGDLARDLGDRPFFGLLPPGLDGHSTPLDCIEDLGAYFEEQVVAFRPAGAFVVAGYGAGGAIAFELGRRLAQAGRGLLHVALFGSPHPGWYQSRRLRRVADRFLRFGSRPAPAPAAALALEQVTLDALRRYRIRPFRGRLVLLVPNRSWQRASVPLWRAAASETRVYYGPPDCRQDTMLRRHAADSAALFRMGCNVNARVW